MARARRRMRLNSPEEVNGAGARGGDDSSNSHSVFGETVENVVET